MNIQVENHQSDLPLNINSVKEATLHTLKLWDVEVDELNVYFLSMPDLCQAHETHFNDPSPTDCISIQVDEPGSNPCFLGEIYIAPQAAIDYSKEHQTQIYPELTLYLVHGILHLLGYDDIDPSDQEKMRLAEKKSMNYLIKNSKLICK